MASVKIVKDIGLGLKNKVKITVEAELPDGLDKASIMNIIRSSLESAQWDLERNIYGVR